MFKEVKHTTTEAIIDLIRTLPKSEQTVIVKRLSEPKKKLSQREKKKQEHLKGIADGLREIMEEKRGGKRMMDLKEALNEL